MNKYKQSLIDALDFIKDSGRCLSCVGSCDECGYYFALGQIENAIETLGELVEKETPKKIQFNVPQQPFLRKKYGKNARYDGICPSCHKSIFPGYKYCPNCGQKLDWG